MWLFRPFMPSRSHTAQSTMTQPEPVTWTRNAMGIPIYLNFQVIFPCALLETFTGDINFLKLLFLALNWAFYASISTALRLTSPWRSTWETRFDITRWLYLVLPFVWWRRRALAQRCGCKMLWRLVERCVEWSIEMNKKSTDKNIKSIWYKKQKKWRTGWDGASRKRKIKNKVVLNNELRHFLYIQVF